MEARDPVLAAWQAAGTQLTMLPSGMEVRLEEVPVAEMVRSGFLPTQLRSLAMRFASAPGVEPDKLEAAEQARWAELERLMICRWVVGVRWTCDCPLCVDRRGAADPILEQAYRLTPEQLAADPPLMPRLDIAALADVVVAARTPRQVDAMSRVAHGQLDADEAWRIIESERVNTLEGWSSFRGQRRGLDAHAHGQDLGGPAVGVPRPNRATRRATARRRPGRPLVAGSGPAIDQPGS